MRAMLIQHSSYGGGGTVLDWAERRGIEVDPVVVVPDVDRPEIAEPLPALDGYDLVVSMGGRWSVYDDIIQTWMPRELALLREATNRDLPVLGICFGGQALAAALGGEVKPATVPEHGWHTIDTDLPDAVPAGPWMEWHSDAFTVPPGATELARSVVCPQAYRIGRSMGVQFHPEIDAALLDGWLASGMFDLDEAGIDEAALRAETTRREAEARVRTGRLLDWFLDDVAQLG